MDERCKRADFRLPIRKAIKLWRYALGWSQKRAAQELGVSQGWWSYNETGRGEFSLRFIERFRQVSGIDVYVLAYALYADLDKLPPRVRELTQQLGEEWSRQVEIMRRCKHRLPGAW